MHTQAHPAVTTARTTPNEAAEEVVSSKHHSQRARLAATYSIAAIANTRKCASPVVIFDLAVTHISR
jgi:hypothetical protein